MKKPVRCLLRQRERETMGKFMIGLLAAVFFGLTVLVACNEQGYRRAAKQRLKSCRGSANGGSKTRTEARCR